MGHGGVPGFLSFFASPSLSCCGGQQPTAGQGLEISGVTDCRDWWLGVGGWRLGGWHVLAFPYETNVGSKFSLNWARRVALADRDRRVERAESFGPPLVCAASERAPQTFWANLGKLDKTGTRQLSFDTGRVGYRKVTVPIHNLKKKSSQRERKPRCSTLYSSRSSLFNALLLLHLSNHKKRRPPFSLASQRLT